MVDVMVDVVVEEPAMVGLKSATPTVTRLLWASMLIVGASMLLMRGNMLLLGVDMILIEANMLLIGEHINRGRYVYALGRGNMLFKGGDMLLIEANMLLIGKTCYSKGEMCY